MLWCKCPSVCPSVTEVHWRIIANLGFKFRSQFIVHCGRGACGREVRDHRREEWRDNLVLCLPLLGTLVLFVTLTACRSPQANILPIAANYCDSGLTQNPTGPHSTHSQKRKMTARLSFVMFKIHFPLPNFFCI